MCAIFEGLWAKILRAGDVSGKLMTLIALPSALFAVLVFFNEIGDSLTSPDVKADTQSVGLRCGPAIDGEPAKEETQNSFERRKCDEALLSAWVKLDLENEDAIDRTLAALAIRIHFPKQLMLAKQAVLWEDTRIVYHILEDDKQTSQRWPWSALLLAPGQRIPLEVDFRAFAKEDQIVFKDFKDLIQKESSPLGDIRIPIEILGRFSGGEGWRVISKCEIDIPQASVDRKRKVKVIRGLTRRCV